MIYPTTVNTYLLFLKQDLLTYLTEIVVNDILVIVRRRVFEARGRHLPAYEIPAGRWSGSPSPSSSSWSSQAITLVRRNITRSNTTCDKRLTASLMTCGCVCLLMEGKMEGKECLLNSTA